MAGYPAATVKEAKKHEKTPHYHKKMDILENLDISHVYKFAHLALAFMVKVGNVYENAQEECKAMLHKHSLHLPHLLHPSHNLMATSGIGIVAIIMFITYKQNAHTEEDSFATEAGKGPYCTMDKSNVGFEVMPA